jgi:hypothetical protein
MRRLPVGGGKIFHPWDTRLHFCDSGAFGRCRGRLPAFDALASDFDLAVARLLQLRN